MEAERPRFAEIGGFLLVVALPLVFTPFSVSPFGDPKLVVLVAAALVLWMARLPGDRTLVVAAALWVAVTAVAAFLGVEPSRSLVAQTNSSGGGLVLMLCCAVILVRGASMGGTLVDRIRGWALVTAFVAGGLGFLVRLYPTFTTDVLGWKGASFVGSTMGNQLFAVALLSASLGATIMLDRPIRDRLIVCGALALLVASFGERSALVLPLVVAAGTLWRAHRPWREAAAVFGTIVTAIIVWQFVDPLLPARPSRVGTTLAPLTGAATDAGRQTAWRSIGAGVLDRPILGWGPGTSQAVYLASGDPEQVRDAGRGWADGHDIFLETAAGTGFLGLAALVFLLIVVGIRAIRCPPERAWAFGAAAGLGAYALVEPLSLVLTPLLFLYLGIASGGSGVQPAWRAPAVARIATDVLLWIAMVVSILVLVASTLERWGRTYGETWAFRAAVAVQPWRVSASEQLALQLALDGRAGDEDAAREAKETIASDVATFPWDVNVRLFASDVDLLLHDPSGAAEWRRAQIERFPGDRELLNATDRERDADGADDASGTPIRGRRAGPFSPAQMRESAQVVP
jgi:O-antigen ligase